MTEIPDRDVFAEIESEVPAPRAKYQRPGDRRRPDDLAAHHPLYVLQDRVTVVARLADKGVGVSAEQDAVRTVDPHQAQLTHGLRDRLRVRACILRQG